MGNRLRTTNKNMKWNELDKANRYWWKDTKTKSKSRDNTI